MITRSIRVNLKIFDTLMPHLPTHLLPRSLQLQKCRAALFKTIGGSWDTFWITNGGGTRQGDAEEIHSQKALVSVRDIPSFSNHSEMSPLANSASTQNSKWRDWHSAFALTSRNVKRLHTSFCVQSEQGHVMLFPLMSTTCKYRMSGNHGINQRTRGDYLPFLRIWNT